MNEGPSGADWDELGDRLAAQSIADGDPIGWFDRLYAAGDAGAVSMPWNRRTPHPLLERWSQTLDGRGKRAIVVGCGLGADAEHVAGLGYETVGFDISETAIRSARSRAPDDPRWRAEFRRPA
jgi:SAM-dependent methyltransferase